MKEVVTSRGAARILGVRIRILVPVDFYEKFKLSDVSAL
jgi:hypothetical protein